jgi:hypothetical protein
LGWSVELVEPPKKPALLKRSYKAWAQEWAKEGIKIEWQKVLPPPPKGFLQVSEEEVGGGTTCTFSWT